MDLIFLVKLIILFLGIYLTLKNIKFIVLLILLIIAFFLVPEYLVQLGF